jgi:hypothetical protein
MATWICSSPTIPCELSFRQQGGKFEQIGDQPVAYSSEGRPRSGMGVDAADYNQDGIDLS